MSWDLFLSELKEGKIHEVVVPVPTLDVADCCSSSTIDESVLETDKKNGTLLKAGMSKETARSTKF